jgi:hypothetical protein
VRGEHCYGIRKQPKAVPKQIQKLLDRWVDHQSPACPVSLQFSFRVGSKVTVSPALPQGHRVQRFLAIPSQPLKVINTFNSQPLKAQDPLLAASPDQVPPSLRILVTVGKTVPVRKPVVARGNRRIEVSSSK